MGMVLLAVALRTFWKTHKGYMDKAQSLKKNLDVLDLAKFVLSFLVVAIHTDGLPIAVYPWLRIAVETQKNDIRALADLQNAGTELTLALVLSALPHSIKIRSNG